MLNPKGCGSNGRTIGIQVIDWIAKYFEGKLQGLWAWGRSKNLLGAGTPGRALHLDLTVLGIIL